MRGRSHSASKTIDTVYVIYGKTKVCRNLELSFAKFSKRIYYPSPPPPDLAIQPMLVASSRHTGLMVKLYQKKIPLYIWHMLNYWCCNSSALVRWNNKSSRPFPIKQRVRQGAILSPLLYSVYVDNLLDTLASSGCGVRIESIYCGAPMYADDLALIADSETDLHTMLHIVSSYASLWL